jgi:hypothetical protein
LKRSGEWFPHGGFQNTKVTILADSRSRIPEVQRGKSERTDTIFFTRLVEAPPNRGEVVPGESMALEVLQAASSVWFLFCNPVSSQFFKQGSLHLGPVAQGGSSGEYWEG